MTDLFTKPELYTLASGLDSLVRVEGRALAENGISAIQSTLGQLNLRLSACVTAHAKLVEMANAPEPVHEETKPKPEPEIAEHVVQETVARAKRVNSAAAN